MLKQERLNQIIDILNRTGKVEVNSLCRIFNVSEMTIRRDLDELVRKNLAQRSHGGAVLPPDSILTEAPYSLRITHNIIQKQAIAKLAKPFIEDGFKIFLDSSTTVYYLAQLLNNSQKILVVTDTLTTALEANARTNTKVISIGGELKKTTNSSFGLFAEEMLSSMYFDVAFLGMRNISKDGILSTSSISELSIKRTVIKNSNKKIILVDSSKLGKPDFLKLGSLSDIDVLITDSKIPTDFLTLCKNFDLDVLTADINNNTKD